LTFPPYRLGGIEPAVSAQALCEIVLVTARVEAELGATPYRLVAQPTGPDVPVGKCPGQAETGGARRRNRM